MNSHRIRRGLTARGGTPPVMRFPCGHAEPEASAAPRVRAAGGRAVWVACQACNVIALVCARGCDR
jgi:hypothetical protein